MKEKVKKERHIHRVTGFSTILFGSAYLWYFISTELEYDFHAILHILTMGMIYIYGGIKLFIISNAPEEKIIEHIKKKEETEKNYPPAPLWGYVFGGLAILGIMSIGYFFLYVNQ